jgi:hypothetical protein
MQGKGNEDTAWLVDASATGTKRFSASLGWSILPEFLLEADVCVSTTSGTAIARVVRTEIPYGTTLSSPRHTVRNCYV